MYRKVKWQELTAAQQVGIILIAIVQFALLGAALWDIRRRPATEINGSKLAWTLLSFINFIGPMTYFLIGRRRPGADHLE